jgi:LemA protein
MGYNVIVREEACYLHRATGIYCGLTIQPGSKGRLMKKGFIVVIVIVVIILAVAGSLIGSYNTLVSRDEGVKTALASIDADLQRRADLVPNLVETVKGAAAHESEAIAAVTKARENMAGASNISEMSAADAELSGALSRLLVVVENYPDLKANANFKDLMVQLEGTENRIAVSRKDYNNAARALNETIRRFPTSILANIFGFRQAEYFEAVDGAQNAPVVEF